MLRLLVAAVLATAITLALAHLGLTRALGAHPFWSAKIAWIGAPVGLVLALGALRLPKLVAAGGFALLTVASLAVAQYGKTGFAASFAEDRFAGQLWYFGWIATAAFFAAALATLGRARGR